MTRFSITPTLNFQREQVFGFPENVGNQKLAGQCQAFMIESLFGKYQEIVGLVPVLTVVAITSDNASKNRTIFKNICRKKCSNQIPKYGTFTLLIIAMIKKLFDAPHI